MILKGSPLTIDDMSNSGWREVIACCKEKTYEHYADELIKACKNAEATGRDRAAESLRLLAQLTSMCLRPNDTTQPFTPFCELGGRRSAVPADFSQDQLNVLKRFLPHISDNELCARVADVIWLRQKDRHAAEIAVEAYLASATSLEDPEHWTDCAERIERALRIALLLNNTTLIDQAIKHIENVLARCNGEDPLYLSERLMGLLCEVGRGEVAHYAAISHILAERARTTTDLHRARTYFEREAEWWRLARNSEQEKVARIAAAETLIEEAEQRLKESPPSHMGAAIFMQNAVEAFRKIPGQKMRARDLHARLLDLQEKSLLEMKAVSANVDLSEVISRAMARVTDKSFTEAFFTLALLAESPRVTKLKKEVEAISRKAPLQFLFETEILNAEGKVIARRPGLSSDGESELAIRAHMFQHARLQQGILVTGIIDPARRQILSEHWPTMPEVLDIIRHSPLVPPGREELFARGFCAGFIGDWIVAGHILVPQFENAVRHLLEQRGIITSSLNTEGIQEEKGLNQALREPAAREIFGDDILFDLEGLLISRFSTNLRNVVAHGLLSSREFISAEVMYFWWLVLRLCLFPLIKVSSPG